MADNSVLSLEQRDDGIAIISINVIGEAQNVIKLAFIAQANAILDNFRSQMLFPVLENLARIRSARGDILTCDSPFPGCVPRFERRGLL